MLDTVLEVLNHPLLKLFGHPTSVAEVLGFITGALSVWYVVRQNIATFPVGIANAVMFFVLFIGAGLYADATLQIAFLAMNAMGWYTWLHLGPSRGKLTQITSATPALLVGVAFAVVALTLLLTPILRAVGDSAPLWDALTTSLSLGAMLLMNFKKLENWVLWALADLVYIPLYVSKGLILTAVVYVIFLIMVIVGYVQWRAQRVGAEPVAITPAAAVAA